jgi:hypothetical protein
VASRNESHNALRNAPPSRPVPSRPLGRDGEGSGGDPGSAGAPPDLAPHDYDGEDVLTALCSSCGRDQLALVHWAHDFEAATDPDQGRCADCGEFESDEVHHYDPPAAWQE